MNSPRQLSFWSNGVTTTGQQFLIAQQISFMTFDNMYSLGFFFKLWFNNDLLTVH